MSERRPDELLCTWPECDAVACIEIKQGLHEPFMPLCERHRGEFVAIPPFQQDSIGWQSRRRAQRQAFERQAA